MDRSQAGYQHLYRETRLERDRHLRALREFYWLIREGDVDVDNALLAVDAYLVRSGVNPEDFAGLNILAPSQVPASESSNA